MPGNSNAEEHVARSKEEKDSVAVSSQVLGWGFWSGTESEQIFPTFGTDSFPPNLTI
jgi:hypothetical protein